MELRSREAKHRGSVYPLSQRLAVAEPLLKRFSQRSRGFLGFTTQTVSKGHSAESKSDGKEQSGRLGRNPAGWRVGQARPQGRGF